MEHCKHKFVFLRSKPSHDGDCYHVGSCLVDEFFCEKCGQKTGGNSQTTTTTSGTIPAQNITIKE